MVKRLLFPAVLLPFFFTASELAAQVKYGVKGGLTLSNARFDDSKTQYATRAHAGLFAQVAFNDKFYLRSEFLYAQKGWKVSADALNPEGVSIKINYLNLPLLPGYHVSEKVSLFIGPELGLKLSAERKPAMSSWGDSIEKIDLGIAAGTNIRVTDNFGIDVRYIYGIRSLYILERRDQNNSPTGEISRIGNNQAIELGVYYIF